MEADRGRREVVKERRQYDDTENPINCAAKQNYVLPFCREHLLRVTEQEWGKYEQVIPRGLHVVKALALHVDVANLVLVEQS